MEYGIRRDLRTAALFGVPAVEAVTAASRGAGQRGQLLVGGGHAVDRGRTAVAVKGDDELGGCRRRVLLKDCFDLHVGTRHGELIVFDGHAAADDLPLLEVVALVRRGGQGDFRVGNRLYMRGGNCAVAAAGHSDGEQLLDLILHRQRAVDPVERIPLVPAGLELGGGDNGVGSGGIACRFRRDFLVVRVKQPIGKGVVQHRIPVVPASFAVQKTGAGHKLCWQRIALGDGCTACRHGESACSDRPTGDNTTIGPWRPRRRGIGHIENVDKGMARLDRPDFHRIVGHSRLAGRINGFLVNLKDSLLSHNRRPGAVFAGI